MTVDLTKLAVWLRMRRLQPKAPAQPEASEVIVGWREDGTAVTWPAASREHASHGLVMASSGGGKTALIAGQIVEEIARDDSDASYLICDPLKGDLIGHVLEGLAARAPHRLAQDTSYLDPFSDGAFAFNLNHLRTTAPLDIFSMQVANLVATLSTASGEQKHLGVGSRQVDVLTHCLAGALSAQHPQASVLWAYDALVVPRGLERLASVCTNDRARQFLLTTKLSDELRSSCSSRLRLAFAAADSLERIVAVAGRCVQLDELLAPKKICLIDLGRPLGGLATLAEFWANLLVRSALDHLLARESPWPHHHTRVCIDEAQVVAQVLSDRAEATLTMGRSKGISLLTATQGTVLLHAASPTLLRVLLGNTPTKFVGRLSAQDAELYARERVPKKGSDENIASVRQKFISSVTNLPDRGFYRIRPGESVRFRSADVDLDGWRRAAQEKEELVEAVKRKLALPAQIVPRVGLADVVPLPERKSSRRRKGGSSPPPASTPTSQTTPSPERPSPPRKPRSRWG